MPDRPDHRNLKAARIVLRDKFSPAEIEEIVERTQHHSGELAPDLPQEKTFGARTGLRMACFTIAFYRALQERGVGKEMAMRLVADANWEAFRRMIAPLLQIGAILFRDPLRRVQWSFRLTRRFVYNPPGWIMEDVPVEDGFGFDVLRCPLADYFRSLGLGELGEGALCELDFRTAELEGIKLVRTGTLAGGAERCDFRWGMK